MKYKIDNKYIVEADSFRDAVKAIKCLKKAILADSMNDAQQVYTIHWIDTYAKSKGYDKTLYRYTTEIKANDVADALKKLSGKVVLDFGVGTANCLVVSVSTPKTTYQWSGRLSALLNNSKEDLGDSVTDAIHDSDASDILKEIKSKYPDVKISNVMFKNLSKFAANALFSFEITGFPEDKAESLGRFVKYCITKRGGKDMSGVHKHIIYASALMPMPNVLHSDSTDGINDADKDFIVVQLVMGNRYKVTEWPAVSAEAALKEFKEANPSWSGRRLQAIPKNEWHGTAADSVQYSVDKPIDDAPDTDTPSGRKQINMSIALTAVRKVLPDHMWNWNGNKITIDNNHIVLVVTDDAVIWKNFKGSKDMRFTNEIALANELREALNL